MHVPSDTCRPIDTISPVCSISIGRAHEFATTMCGTSFRSKFRWASDRRRHPYDDSMRRGAERSSYLRRDEPGWLPVSIVHAMRQAGCGLAEMRSDCK